MFLKLENLPIKRKLTVIGLTVAGLAIVLMTSMLAGVLWLEKRDSALAALRVHAGFIGDNSAHAVLFNDDKTAREVLAQLRAEPAIQYAAIRSKSGELQAQFARDEITARPPAELAPGEHLFFSGRLGLTKSLDFDGQNIGTLYLQRDMAGDYRQILEQLGMFSGAILLAMAAAAMLFTRFQKAITGPIQELSGLMKRVTEENDYSLRTTVRSQDELGMLGEGFNAMLEAVDDRDQAIDRYRLHLEEMVQQRSEALIAANADLQRQVEIRQQAEEQLQELNAELEQRVREEVEKNREKDHLLIQQSRLAAMGEMVHNIAHQWRQPLNTLGLIVQNLRYDFRDGLLSGELMEQAAAKAMQVIQSMSRTIDDFRNFFRPDQLTSDFDIAEAVEQSLNILGPALDNHHIQVETAFARGLLAHGHPSQFSQVVLNLLSNAKEAILQRGVAAGRITLHLVAAGEWSVLEIEDNGGGIPADIIAKIFEPYFTSKEKGSGIGLYMSKTIVERNMDGTITAANNESGACFTVRLPLVAAVGQ